MEFKTEEELKGMTLDQLEVYSDQVWAHNVKLRVILKMKQLNIKPRGR